MAAYAKPDEGKGKKGKTLLTTEGEMVMLWDAPVWTAKRGNYRGSDKPAARWVADACSFEMNLLVSSSGWGPRQP